MPGAINIVVSHNARLIAIGLPKCGSSSLIDAFLQMEGFRAKPRKVRSLAVRLRASGELAAAGLEFLQSVPQDIPAVVAANPSYAIFSVIRDPYRRIYSAYFNKLNRYTKSFRKDLFWRGQLARLLAGPKGWTHVEVGNIAVHRHLSFTDFLKQLQRYGISLDPHFEAQVTLLNIAAVKYDRLLDLKDLAGALKPLLSELGTPAVMLARLPDIPHANKVIAASASVEWLTPQTIGLINQLYAEDFRQLNFPQIG